MTSVVLVALEHVSLERSGQFILRDVSVNVRYADRLALVGRNGAGKSTLLQLLAGQHTVTGLSSRPSSSTLPSAVLSSATPSSATPSSSVLPSATPSSAVLSSATPPPSQPTATLPPSTSSAVTVTGHVWRAPGVRVTTLPDVRSLLKVQADRSQLSGVNKDVSDINKDVSDKSTTLAHVAHAALSELGGLEQDMRQAEQRLSHLAPTDPRLATALEHYATLQERFEQAGGYDTPQRVEQALASFGLTAEQSLEHLSPAQQQQLALALGLLRARSFADVLLLDEPERHLDISSRQQLIAALQALPIAVVVASHDRTLLDAVAKRVVYVEAGNVHVYRGNYSAFLRQHDSERVQLARLAQQRRQQRQALERTRANAPTPDARKRAQERLARLEPVPASPAQATPTSLPLGYETRPAQTLLRVQTLYVRQLENISFQLTAGTTIALVGAHGVGKTTLFEAIAGKLEPSHPDTRLHWANDAKLAYFDAEAGLDDAPLLEQLEPFVSTMRARALLALVGLAKHADKTATELSSGQRARAGLAKVMAQDATVLLLDNPNEHLDVELTAVLENALLDSPAAILLATHDAALIARVADQVWHLEAGTLHVYANLAAYQRGDVLPNLAEPQHDPAQARLLAGDRPRDCTTTATQAERQQAALAAQEDSLEQDLQRLDEALLDPGQHSERQRERLVLRRKQVLNEVSWCYEQRQPAPRPAYDAREGAVQVWLDLDTVDLDTADLDTALAVTPESAANSGAGINVANGVGDEVDDSQLTRTATFTSNAWVQGHVFIQKRTGHVQWQTPPDCCVLPWALERVLWAVVRIAFMHLELQVVQTQYATLLPAFQDAGGSWQTLTRRRFAWLEGYPPVPTPQQSTSQQSTSQQSTPQQSTSQ